MTPLSQQIREAAERLKIGPTELARRVGRGHPQVSRHMRGEHEPTDEAVIQSYADALGIELVAPAIEARTFRPQHSSAGA